LDGIRTGERGREIAELIARMAQIQDRLARDDARRHFHSTYLRTTRAVAAELETGSLGGFVDPPWVERWDVEFAKLYLAPFDAWDRTGTAPGPWASVFRSARDQPGLQPLRHILFGINVHVNFDLPQALLAVITDDGFDDPAMRARRERDHVHIDLVLASRVSAEDQEVEGRTLLDRVLSPLNRLSTKRFLKEAREKVWRNAIVLSRARREGPEALRARIEELGALCAARVEDLIAPGQVLIKLARRGFGVLLPDA
jgi:Family of unknown function (DUF5995)